MEILTMQDIFKKAIYFLERGEPIAIATAVRTKGSTPQKAGARLLVCKDGTSVGTLGGGCIEGSVWCTAKELLNKGGTAQYLNYCMNAELAAQDGMICGGTMWFLIEPVVPNGETLTYMKAIETAFAGGKPVAWATLIHRAENDATSTGTKLFIRDDGVTRGSLGKLELNQGAVKRALELMATGMNEYVAADNGADYFIEAFTTMPFLILCGGGHIAKALAPLAKNLGFRLCIIDERQEFANKERFPEADVLIQDKPDKALSELSITPNTFIVVATPSHYHDDVSLEAAARTPARYLGLVGSKRKTLLVYKHLIHKGVHIDRIKKIHAPIGLDICARTPEEIAISIMAEILMFKSGGTGQKMKLQEWQITGIEKQVNKSTVEAL